MQDYKYWVEKLKLQPHPEGGYYKETYRSTEEINGGALPKRFVGTRNYSTAIYFMLTDDNFSAFHRIQSDEVWHFYKGDGITVSVLHLDGRLEEIKLGSNIDKGEVFQAVVPAGTWFGSKLTDGGKWCLVGCTVAPGFDFEDFEMANRSLLLKEFPQHSNTIQTLTR